MSKDVLGCRMSWVKNHTEGFALSDFWELEKVALAKNHIRQIFT